MKNFKIFFTFSGIILTSFFVNSCSKDDSRSNNLANITTETRTDPNGGGGDPNVQQCDAIIIDNTSNSFQMPIIGMATNYTNLYFMRDHILNSTTKGTSYINYYYSISKYINDVNLYSNYADYLSIYRPAHFVGFNLVVNYLNINFNGILINDTDANILKQMSLKIKTLNPPQSVVNTLNVLENDLIFLKNKPAADVRNFFQ